MLADGAKKEEQESRSNRNKGKNITQEGTGNRWRDLSILSVDYSKETPRSGMAIK